jgi:Chalcone isomerase-like
LIAEPPTMPTPRSTVSRRALLAACGGLCVVSVRAQAAAPAEVAAELPAAKLLGSGRLTYFGLHIYDARLWVADGFSADNFAMIPLALELEYARSLVGKLIAERSLDEMKRIGGFSEEQGQRWLAAMTQTFPDVNKGDRLTGVHRPGESANFFLNAKGRGEVRDADFARRFFGIWLSAQTSEPKLRASLLGLNRAGS